MGFAKITGTGVYIPEKILSNKDLESLVDTSDEWIKARTGISERRILDEDKATSDMCYEACLQALENSSTSPDEIDGIIVATISPDYMTPSVACLLQDRLKTRKIFAFDVSAGCSGFIYAVTVKGVTGGENALSADVTDYLKKVHEISKIPVCAGFGIRDKSDVEMIAEHVDGIIVGSAIVETIEQGNSPTEFLDRLKN